MYESNQYRVFVSVDDCVQGEPLFRGTYEACRDYVRKHLKSYSRKGCWLEIMGSMGRLLSYVL